MDKKIPLPNEDGGTQRHKTKINRLDTELTHQPTYFFLKCQYAKIQSICRGYIFPLGHKLLLQGLLKYMSGIHQSLTFQSIILCPPLE